MTDKTQPTAHAEITAPISADLRRMDSGAQPETLAAAARRLANVADQVRALEPEGGESDVYLTEASKVLRECAGRIAGLEVQVAAKGLQQSAQPDALAEVSKEQYARMFGAACDALGQISDHLGIDSDIDPGAEPIIEAIDELRAAALQAAPPAAAAVAVPPLTPDEARRAARTADLMRGPSDTTQPAAYAMAGALALAAKLAAPPAQEHATQLAGQALPADEFRGDTASLVRNIVALLDLDAKGCLVPHGVGGHARGLLSAAASRLAAAPAQAQEEARDGLALFAADHEGTRVDYRGMLGQAQRALQRTSGGYAEMLRQLEGHLTELGQRWYAGDTAAVDEILQLYCIEREARATARAAQGGAA